MFHVFRRLIGFRLFQVIESGRCTTPELRDEPSSRNCFLSIEALRESCLSNVEAAQCTKATKSSVLVEDLDLALLQEGCIVNFCSLFFDSPEPFSVIAFSSKTQVFSITKTELFSHMPPSQG